MPRRSGFRRICRKVQADVGLPGFRFHDLRHVGNTLASDSGAGLKELMTRMGHSSTRAALIYRHASKDRGQAIARALGQAFKKARDVGHKKASGTPRARKILKFWKSEKARSPCMG
ncbi:tyrosine-type recombinase/integrase [Streptosporangium sp. CA-115845]|uniref:tyrosine-type recombinase/integrase n=1 Tax=Streptosporangium sp. CA-115845 TaxID=3240071 RepID=UPI003D8ACEBA